MLRENFSKFIRWVGYDLGLTPNQITVGRLIIFVPAWFLWVYKMDLAEKTGIWWQALGLIAFLLVTFAIVLDAVDGALARETGKITKTGKFLDPIIDKFITYTTLILFWNVINKTALIILFVLDMISTFMRSAVVQSANQFGKKRAICQNVSKIFFGAAVLLSFPLLNSVGNLFIWAAVLLAGISVGFRLVPENATGPIARFLPNMLSMGNFLCGCAAAVCAVTGKINLGIMFIFIAMGLDISDGAIARKIGVKSKYGETFDTAGDVVSFGVSPAMLLMASAGWSIISIISGLIYLAATVTRLIDYTVTKKATPKNFFRGMPSPAGAWLALTIIVCIPPSISPYLFVIPAILMCAFWINWQHFGSIIPTLGFHELTPTIIIGLIPALLVTPLGIISGPVIVYAFSPIWRRPEKINKEAEQEAGKQQSSTS